MRKAVVGGLAALALVVTAFVLAPTVWTQVRPAPAPLPEPRMMLLEGRGSSIGVRVRDLDKEDLAKAKLQQAGGALIAEVEEESPAEKAGLRAGDIVVEFDGERVRSARHFSRLVQETPDGRAVRATVLRDGARQTLDVTPSIAENRWERDMILRVPEVEPEVERGLRALPRHFAFDFDWDAAAPEVFASSRGRLGVRLQSLTEQLAEFFGAQEGVLVSSVEPDSPAAKAGLKAGDVITSINGRTVDSPRDVTQELRDRDEGGEVEIGILREKKSMTLKAAVPERRRSVTRATRPA